MFLGTAVHPVGLLLDKNSGRAHILSPKLRGVKVPTPSPTFPRVMGSMKFWHVVRSPQILARVPGSPPRLGGNVMADIEASGSFRGRCTIITHRVITYRSSPQFVKLTLISCVDDYVHTYIHRLRLRKG